jgi:hypothetical protein
MKMAKNDTTPLAKGKVILTHAKRPPVALIFSFTCSTAAAAAAEHASCDAYPATTATAIPLSLMY